MKGKVSPLLRRILADPALAKQLRSGVVEMDGKRYHLVPVRRGSPDTETTEEGTDAEM